MTSLLTGLLRGTAAGAAGTTALELSTQADMAIRGRGPSDSPTEAVSALVDRAGVSIPGGRRERTHRLRALGGIGGPAVGVGLGAVAGVLRAAGVRLPGVIGGPVLGAAAMAASDGSMAGLGLTDPRSWSAETWVTDAVPHLVYGVATHATLVATFSGDERARRDRPDGTRRPATAGGLVKAAALGAATGARSALGLTALAVRARREDHGLSGRLARPARRALHVAMAAGEIGADKHPAIPSRLDPTALVARLTFAAVAADATARRDQREGGPGALVAVGAAAGTAVGAMRLRGLARDRFGSDLPGAITEDVLAALLAWAGTARPTRVPH